MILRGRSPKKATRFATTSRTKRKVTIADGFVAKSEDREKDAAWADIIIFDETLGQGEKAQELRARGKK